MIEGTLVRLRAFERSDVDANHAFVNDMETLRGMISGIPFPASMEDEYRWLEQQSSYSRGEYQFAVEDFEGDLVGRCGVIRLDWKNRLAELAIMIGTPYRGRGYGRGLLRELARLALERGCGRLEWCCLDWNRPSIDFYRSLGAVPMDEWTTYRLTGETLRHMAE